METKYPLYTLLIEVTKKCNAACDQCGSRCDIRSEELLPKEQILSALHDIKEGLGTYTMLNITGAGEARFQKEHTCHYLKPSLIGNASDPGIVEKIENLFR